MAPSIQETNPEFSLKNIFKPTPKNKIILGMTIKTVSVGFITLSTTVLAMVALVSDLSKTLLISGLVLNIIAVLTGAYGEMVILMSREVPESTLAQMAEEIKPDTQTVTLESPAKPQQDVTIATDTPVSVEPAPVD